MYEVNSKKKLILFFCFFSVFFFVNPKDRRFIRHRQKDIF